MPGAQLPPQERMRAERAEEGYEHYKKALQRHTDEHQRLAACPDPGALVARRSRAAWREFAQGIIREYEAAEVLMREGLPWMELDVSGRA